MRQSSCRFKLLGVEHPDTLSSMRNLASTYWNQGKLNEAEQLQVQVLGVDHADTLTSIRNLTKTRGETVRQRSSGSSFKS